MRCCWKTTRRLVVAAAVRRRTGAGSGSAARCWCTTRITGAWSGTPIRDQLLMPPANWCPIFASRTTQGVRGPVGGWCGAGACWPAGPPRPAFGNTGWRTLAFGPGAHKVHTRGVGPDSLRSTPTDLVAVWRPATVLDTASDGRGGSVRERETLPFPAVPLPCCHRLMPLLAVLQRPACRAAEDPVARGRRGVAAVAAGRLGAGGCAAARLRPPAADQKPDRPAARGRGPGLPPQPGRGHGPVPASGERRGGGRDGDSIGGGWTRLR